MKRELLDKIREIAYENWDDGDVYEDSFANDLLDLIVLSEVYSQRPNPQTKKLILLVSRSVVSYIQSNFLLEGENHEMDKS